MEYENEGIQSDVQDQAPESSPAPEQDASSDPTINQEPQAPAETPFHEHPRFKELVEQKNQYSTQLKQYESQMRQMQHEIQQFKQSQQASKPNPDKELLERLKGIDPIFGSKFEQVSSAAEKVAHMEHMLQQVEQQRVQEQYVSNVNNLFTQNNVPKEWHEIYDAQIEKVAKANPHLGLKDLPQVFKDIHSNLSKLRDQQQREERKSYVQDKTKDTKLPTSQPKGKPVGGKKEELPLDREERNASIAKAAVAKYRAGNNL